MFLVDAKGTARRDGSDRLQVVSEGREPYTSPLLKLRSHARTIKGLTTDSHPNRNDLGGIYVDAVVLMTSDERSSMTHRERRSRCGHDQEIRTILPGIGASPRQVQSQDRRLPEYYPEGASGRRQEAVRSASIRQLGGR